MANSETEMIESDSEKEIVQEDVKIQYFWYLLVLFTIFLISNLIPAFLFMTYFLLFFIPSFLENTNFLSIFITLKPLFALITMPLVIIGCYLIRLFLIALVAV